MYWKNARAAQGHAEPTSPHLLAVSLMLPPSRPRQTPLSQQPPRSQLSKQPPRTQLFLVSRGLAIAAPNVLAWIGTHHPAVMEPTKFSCPATNASLHLWFRAAPRHHRFRTAGCRQPRLSACRQASSRPLPLMQTFRQLVSAPSTARCDFVWRTLSRVAEKTTATTSMPGVCSFLARRAGMTLLWRTCTLIRNLCRTTRSWCPVASPPQRLVLIRRTNGRQIS